MPILLDKLVAFGAPAQKETTIGKRLVREARPTPLFWAAWSRDKDLLRSCNVRCPRDGEKFTVQWIAQKDGTFITPDQFIRDSKTRAPKAVAAERKTWKCREPGGLLSYQVPHLETLASALLTHGAAFDASDMGTGKTFVACGLARELGLRPAVIAPKSILSSWRKVAKTFDVDPLWVLNYEKVKLGHSEHCQKGSYKWSLPEKSMLVFDEVHRCRNRDTQNAALLLAAKEAGAPVLTLSATGAFDPLDMYALGQVLGMHHADNFWDWAMARGVKKASDGEWHFVGGLRHLRMMHEELFPEHGSRIRIDELGDLFPATQVTTESIDIGDTGIALVEEAWNRALNEYWGTGAETLVAALRAWQVSERLKLPALCELSENALAEKHSVVIFVQFRETLALLESAFAKYAPAMVHGDQTAEQRGAEQERFQSDRTRVCLCQITAGGVGLSLDDIHGRFPRVALLCPSPSAISLRQALGRVRRAGSKSKSLQRILFAAGTLEEGICEKVARKLNQLDTLNDGDLVPESSCTKT